VAACGTQIPTVRSSTADASSGVVLAIAEVVLKSATGHGLLSRRRIAVNRAHQVAIFTALVV
jgi:hypothetical protein